MCFQNRFSRSDHQWKYGTKEIKGKTKVKNPERENRFGNTQNQTLNKLSCCVVMSAAFILFIAIIKLLSPRRLFVPFF